MSLCGSLRPYQWLKGLRCWCLPHGEVTCGGVDWDVSTANSSLQTMRLTGCVVGKSYAVKMW